MPKGLLALCSSLMQNGPRGRREREFYELISRLVALDRSAALDSQQGHRDFGQVVLPLTFLGYKSCRSLPSTSSTESAGCCCCQARCCGTECSSQGRQSDRSCTREPCTLHGCMHRQWSPPRGRTCLSPERRGHKVQLTVLAGCTRGICNLLTVTLKLPSMAHQIDPVH